MEKPEVKFEGSTFKVTSTIKGFEDLKIDGCPASEQQQLDATQRQIKSFINVWREQDITKKEILKRLKDWSGLEEIEKTRENV